MASISTMVAVRSGTADDEQAKENGRAIRDHVERAIVDIFKEHGLLNYESVSSVHGEPQYLGPFIQPSPEICAEIVNIGVFSHHATEEIEGPIICTKVYPAERLFDTLSYYDNAYCEVQP
jgi:hypothetical protein